MSNWIKKADEPTRRLFKQAGAHAVYVGLNVQYGTSDDTNKRVIQTLKSLAQCNEALKSCLEKMGLKLMSY